MSKWSYWKLPFTVRRSNVMNCQEVIFEAKQNESRISWSWFWIIVKMVSGWDKVPNCPEAWGTFGLISGKMLNLLRSPLAVHLRKSIVILCASVEYWWNVLVRIGRTTNQELLLFRPLLFLEPVATICITVPFVHIPGKSFHCWPSQSIWKSVMIQMIIKKEKRTWQCFLYWLVRFSVDSGAGLCPVVCLSKVLGCLCTAPWLFALHLEYRICCWLKLVPVPHLQYTSQCPVSEQKGQS